MFAVMNNRGAQLGLHDVKADAEKQRDEYNRNSGDVFAWVINAPSDAKHEDIPGLSFLTI